MSVLSQEKLSAWLSYVTCMKLPTWFPQLPARNREAACGNSKLPFWVPGCGDLVDVKEESNSTESGNDSRILRPELWSFLSSVTSGLVVNAKASSLNFLPNGVSSGGA